MIARLSGTLVEKQPGAAVVDVAGVGYQVAIPLSTFYDLGDPGSHVELLVHTHVREDVIALFGFRTRFEKEMFSRLIGVSGIGPRTALAVLSGLGAAELIDSVRTRDVDRLSAIPGIGRKTAERIVIDLKDRIEALPSPVDGAQAVEGGAAGPVPPDMRQDLVSALVNLGYNARAATDAAMRVMKGAGAPTPPFQALLRETLRMLSR